MTDYSADSSALLKRHVHEVGSIWFQALADPLAGNTIITARISLAEVYSALNRRRREADFTATDYAAIVADFSALCDAEYDLIELLPGIIDQARLLLERYVLRAYDAVQLASARSARNRLQQLPLPVNLPNLALSKAGASPSVTLERKDRPTKCYRLRFLEPPAHPSATAQDRGVSENHSPYFQRKIA